VAFVDASGRPGWIGDDPSLRPHAPSLRGCWPHVHGVESGTSPGAHLLEWKTGGSLPFGGSWTRSTLRGPGRACRVFSPL